MQQKTSLIIALAQDSELLILDEPNLGLDLESLIVLKHILKDESLKRTIILTTQDSKLIEDITDYIFVLDKGKLKYSAKMEEFNSISRDLFITMTLNINLSDDIKEKIQKFSDNVKFSNNKIYGEFKKDSIDDIIRVLQGLNYKVVDMHTRETFETNLTTILNIEGGESNA
jgi:ABC-2 type transport system ATP-binding protein